MQSLTELTEHSFPDSVVNVGPWPKYEPVTLVIVSDDNFRFLIEEHNKLVDAINNLIVMAFSP